MISERMQMTPENELQMVPAAQKRASRAPPGSCVSTPQAPLPSGWPSAAWRRCPGEGAAKWGRPSCVPEQKRGGAELPVTHPLTSWVPGPALGH